MMKGDMARRTMAVKSRQEGHLMFFLPPSMPLSVPLISSIVSSIHTGIHSPSTFNPSTAAAVTVNGYHDVCARCGAETHSEDVNTFSLPLPSVQIDRIYGQRDIELAGSRQEDQDDGAWPIFAALAAARSVVASSQFGPVA